MAPSARAGTPRGATSSATPTSAVATAQPGGACCCQAAAGAEASASSGTISAANTACAACQGASNGTTIAHSASGTTANVTTGIATALATGAMSDACWNSARVIGANPSVTTHCACAPSRTASRNRARHPRVRAARRRPADAYSNKPTAPNESQNPGVKPAHGSHTSTASSAHNQITAAVPGRASTSPSAATLNISSVRTAGTPDPASRT